MASSAEIVEKINLDIVKHKGEKKMASRAEIVEKFNLDPRKNVVVLVNPSENEAGEDTKIWPQLHPPVSAMTVASHLIARGYQSVIFDMRVKKYQELELFIENNSSDIAFIGTTVFVGAFISEARKITSLARKFGLQSVFGGPFVDVFPELAINECDSISGPMPFEEGLDWSMIPMSKYQKPYLAVIFTSVGCPYRCTFCYLQSYNKKIQARTTESVLQEMDQLNSDYGITEFQIGDDNFFTFKKRSIEILNSMKDRGYTVIKCIGAQQDFNESVIEAIDGVVKTVSFSLEAADEAIIKKIRKPVKLGKAMELNKRFAQMDISITNNIILGWPFESPDHKDKIYELFDSMKKENPRFRGLIYAYTSLPGTPLTEEVENKFGVFPNTWDFWIDCNFQISEQTVKYRPWLTHEEQFELAKVLDDMNRIYDNNYVSRDQTKEFLKENLYLT